MAIIKADANKLIEAGEEIAKLTNEYNELIDELYDKLFMINKTCWSSQKADTYVTMLKNDKLKNKMISNCLVSYSNVLKNSGNQINSIIDGEK